MKFTKMREGLGRPLLSDEYDANNYAFDEYDSEDEEFDKENALDKHFSKKYDDEYEDDDFTFEDFDESRDFLIFKLNKLHESNRINKKTFKKLFKVLKEVKLGCWGIARNGKLMAYSYEDDTEAKEAKKKLEKDFPKETFEVASPEDIDNGVYKDPVASESAARGDKLGKSFSKIIK